MDEIQHMTEKSQFLMSFPTYSYKPPNNDMAVSLQKLVFLISRLSVCKIKLVFLISRWNRTARVTQIFQALSRNIQKQKRKKNIP